MTTADEISGRMLGTHEARPLSDEVSKRTGPVSPDEALEALLRFCHSHFGKDDRARISIPANPQYDDDLRLHAFIHQARERWETEKRLRAEIAQLEERSASQSASLKACQGERDDVRHENRQLHESLDALIEERRTRAGGVEKALATLGHDIDRLDTELAAKSEQLDAANAEAGRLSAENEALRAEVKALSLSPEQGPYRAQAEAQRQTVAALEEKLAAAWRAHGAAAAEAAKLKIAPELLRRSYRAFIRRIGVLRQKVYEQYPRLPEAMDANAGPLLKEFDEAIEVALREVEG